MSSTGFMHVCLTSCSQLLLDLFNGSRGAGGLRKLRAAGRSIFHLSWYLTDFMGRTKSNTMFLFLMLKAMFCFLILSSGLQILELWTSIFDST